MIAIDKAIQFVVSKEKPLCQNCSGLGSIWVFQKEQVCKECNGTGLAVKEEHQVNA